MGVVAYGSWAEARLRAIDVLFEQSSWADVVRESQEVVELALKGLLRTFGIAVPFVHDVSDVLTANLSRLPPNARPSVPRWCEISKQLRRDRELSFYGSEDVTPSEFYGRADAETALSMARELVAGVAPHVA